MRKPSTLAQRQADRQAGLVAKKEAVRKLAETSVRLAALAQLRNGRTAPLQVAASPPPPEPDAALISMERPWASVRSGQAGCTFEERATGVELGAQPWTRGMLDSFLEVADHGGVEVCLVWPTSLRGVAQLHGLANVERLCVKDLRGLRTLIYPGNTATRLQLESVLIRRSRFAKLFSSLWSTEGKGPAVVLAETKSDAMVAALHALNDLDYRNTGAVNPSLAELVPTFV